MWRDAIPGIASAGKNRKLSRRAAADQYLRAVIPQSFFVAPDFIYLRFPPQTDDSAGQQRHSNSNQHCRNQRVTVQSDKEECLIKGSAHNRHQLNVQSLEDC